MSLDEIKDALINGPNKEKYDAFSNLKEEDLDLNIFKILCQFIRDGQQENRFFALTYLIEKFSDELSKELDDHSINDFYNLLFDESAPVADRSIWALSTIGDSGLNKLITEYEAATFSVKCIIARAIGRGQFSYRTFDRVEVLLDGLKSDDNELRFTSMCQLMDNSPIGPWNSDWNSTNDTRVNFEDIYKLVQPIAEEFSKSEDKLYGGFSIRYLDWINEANK